MRAAMQVLAAAPKDNGGRRIAVLGDMLELGSHSAKLHEALGGIVAESEVDLLLLAGKEMKALADSAPEGVTVEYRESADELEPLLLETVRPGDTVMMKASKSIGFAGLVNVLLKHFSSASAEKPAQ